MNQPLRYSFSGKPSNKLEIEKTIHKFIKIKSTNTQPGLKLILICVFSLLIFFCNWQTAKAQYNFSYYPFLKNFKRSEYKAGMQTWMISQAPNGLLYFANNIGLVEFDGHNWELYGIYNYTIIRSVLAEEDGKIYVGLSNNFGYFKTDSTGRLNFNSMLNLLPPDQRDIEEIWKIYKTSDGIIFQSFESIIVVSKDHNHAKIYKAPSKFHYSFHINNKLYISDEKEGILEFRDESFYHLKGTNLLSGKEISAILPYGKDLMITTVDNGVYIYQDKQLKKWVTPVSGFLEENQIYCALRIDEEQIAFGTIQKGLVITNNSGVPKFALDKSKGLQNNTILSMSLDNSGNLWLGTDNGIDLLYLNSPLSQLNLNQNIGTGYAAIVHNNILYLGTNQGIFYKKWGTHNELSQRFDDFKLIKGTKGQVWNLQIIDNELFCGHNKGTFLIEGTEAKKISDINGAWKFLQSEKNPNRIIAGTYTGFILFEKENGTWKFKYKIKGFHESSRMIYFDENENIWMSHGFKGVYHISFNEQYDSVLEARFYNSKNGFNTDFGINLTMLQNMQVFLSSNGAYKFDKVLDTVIPSEYFNTFFSDLKVNNAIEDIYGNIWYFENFSLAVKLIKADGTYEDVSMPFKHLQGDFIEGFQFVYPINENNFLISCKDGFIHFNPSNKIAGESLFNRYLSKVELLKNDSVLFKGHLFDINQVIPHLRYKENSIRFSFSAINYDNPDKVEFSTFLEGHDKEWSRWEKRYDREFTNLPEGEYVLLLKARNIYQSETSVLQYRFIISPPWKRTKIAFAIYILSTVLIISLIVYLVIRRVSYLKLREQRVQKEKFSEREKLLREETLIAEKEIIKLRNEKLKEEIKNKDKELANSTMQTIQKNKFLIGLKKDMSKNNSEMISETAKRQNKFLIRKIDNEINNEKNWKVFEKHFINVHEEFIIKLKNEYPQISPAELKLCACLRMNISSKEIASLLNISLRGVEASRYRLRKALDLDRKINLTDFIMSI